MKLEEQVASLELCEQLPEDAFADSAFVWYYPYNEGSHWDLIPRSEAGKEPMYAAPTLQEILREMAANHPNYIREITVEVDAPIEFTVVAHTSDYYDDNEYQYDANAATAALKLWLDLTKGGKDGK